MILGEMVFEDFLFLEGFLLEAFLYTVFNLNHLMETLSTITTLCPQLQWSGATLASLV